MTSRRLWAAGLIAVALGVTWGRGRRARRPTGLIHTFLVWNVVGSILAPWDGVAGFFGDVGSRVRDLVTSVVSEAVGWLEDLINTAVESINAVFRGVWGAFQQIWTWVAAAFQHVYDWTAQAIGAIYQWTSGLVGQVYGYVQGTIAGMLRWVQGLVGSVWSWVQGALGQLKDWVGGLLSQLWAYAHGLAGWVVDHVWTPLYGLILSGLDNLRTWVADRFADLWNLLPAPVRAILEAALHAVDWLVWMATHPFDFFRTVLDDLFHKGPRWLMDQTAQAFQQEGAGIEETLARWLG